MKGSKLTTTPLPPSPETWAQPVPPPPALPKRRFFAWRSDRPRWQVIALFTAAVLVGIGIGAPSGSNDDGGSDEIASLREQSTEYRDQRDAAVAEVSDLREQAAATDTEIVQRSAELDARQTELDEREAGLDAREGEIAGAEATAEANTIPGDGLFVVGVDIQPGTYKSAGPSSDGFGSGYWARLSGTSGNFEEIITNAVPTGPTTVTIQATDVAFETTTMQDWSKVG